ncbi:MAG: MurT ligase domain-containing protein [Solirubrobacterales bacterium]
MSPTASPPPSRSRMFATKRALARAIGGLSRLSGRGGGTTLPGRVLLHAAPDAISRLSSRLEHGSTVVSATNGKTTTASMIAAAMSADGRHPVHNKAGSNMAWGVATALLEGDGEEGLFEVDEAWLPEVCEALEPRLLVLGNLFRDQLDRYGELEHLAEEWSELIARLEGRCRFVLCADDPLIADLGRDGDRVREGVSYFGIDDSTYALAELQHAHDAKHCRRCGAPYDYSYVLVGHLGHYSCPNCGARRPEPEVAATAVELDGIAGSRFSIRTPEGSTPFELPIPVLYNVYNATAAIAAARAHEISVEVTREAVAGLEAVFGRVETIKVEGRQISILLVKNPAGANEVLRTIKLEAGEGTPLQLWLALNDRIADGRDVSWIWDADFELLTEVVGEVTCAGTRAAEMALRLKYAGWPEQRIEVIEDIPKSLERARERASGRLFALPTYTALIELRTMLADAGHAGEFWR